MLSSSRFCSWVILLYIYFFFYIVAYSKCMFIYKWKSSQFTNIQTILGVDPTFDISGSYDISSFNFICLAWFLF